MLNNWMNDTYTFPHCTRTSQNTVESSTRKRCNVILKNTEKLQTLSSLSNGKHNHCCIAATASRACLLTAPPASHNLIIFFLLTILSESTVILWTGRSLQQHRYDSLSPNAEFTSTGFLCFWRFAHSKTSRTTYLCSWNEDFLDWTRE